MNLSLPETSIPQSPPLAGERLAFTGVLASMTHRQAQARVVECGGVATEHVSRQTTMLVVGEEGWPLEADGRPSEKLEQIVRWQQEGQAVRIVRESEWLGFVGLDGQRELDRLATPAMLSRTLNVSVHAIRRWERLGLIRAVSRVGRLPYFDAREVAGARRLSELVEAGVSISEIQKSLARLDHVLGEMVRPLALLEILARDRRLLYRSPQGRLMTVSGQMLLDFEEQEDDVARPVPVDEAEEPADRMHWGASEWCDEARRLLEDGESTAAVEACRMGLMIDHDVPEAHLQLAESLYRIGNRHGALERYHVAVELDHEYLEAWTQMGCLYSELGELAAAAEAFRIALSIHSDYADAHLHLAQVLQQSGEGEAALPHWRRTLELDSHGPWADTARQHIEAWSSRQVPVEQPGPPA
jgi:Tfp pilus assembly protein PilF/DNA-binding transcriptional MerR regulator